MHIESGHGELETARVRVRDTLRRFLRPRGLKPVRSILLYAEDPGRELVFHEGVGTVGRNRTTVDHSFQFNIASITKTFVSALILQLVEEGRINLCDLAVEHLGHLEFLRLPELHILDGQPRAAEITVDHLLQHRSGLGDVFIDTALRFTASVFLHRRRSFSPETIVERYFDYGLNRRPHFAPGTGYHYSDLNYVLLGLLLEKVTGESLHERIRRRILAPLDLTDTYFEYKESPCGVHKRVDSYYGPLNMTRFINQSYEWSGGGLVSTTSDLARFMKALLSGDLYAKEATLACMLDCTRNQLDGSSYARGVFRFEIDGVGLFGHAGFYGSRLMASPESGTLLAIHVAQATPPFDLGVVLKTVLGILRSA